MDLPTLTPTPYISFMNIVGEANNKGSEKIKHVDEGAVHVDHGAESFEDEEKAGWIDFGEERKEEGENDIKSNLRQASNQGINENAKKELGE